MYVRFVVEGGVLEDLARVPGDRVVELLRAQARQCAQAQARLWATMVEVGLVDPAAPAGCDGPAMRTGTVAGWAAGEIAAALTWTHRTADWELGLAEVVVRELPDVFAFLSAGRIDRGKAVVFAQHLDPAHGLTSAQTQAILARLLPVAPRLTTSQLRGRLWRALLAIDPGWARRRYTRAVRARAVTAVLADDGTVTVTGSGLPADEAAVACARVDRLAEAAKRAGHPGRVGQIAADVFLGLLDGRFHSRTEDQIIAALLREPRPEDTRDDGLRPGGPAHDSGRPNEDTGADDRHDRARHGRCAGREHERPGDRQPGHRPPPLHRRTQQQRTQQQRAGTSRHRGPGRVDHAARARRAARGDPRARPDPRAARPCRRRPAVARCGVALRRHRRRGPPAAGRGDPTPPVRLPRSCRIGGRRAVPLRGRRTAGLRRAARPARRRMPFHRRLGPELGRES